MIVKAECASDTATTIVIARPPIRSANKDSMVLKTDSLPEPALQQTSVGASGEIESLVSWHLDRSRHRLDKGQWQLIADGPAMGAPSDRWNPGVRGSYRIRDTRAGFIIYGYTETDLLTY